MLLLIPVAVGIGIGIIILFLTKLFKNKSAFISKFPSLMGLVSFVILMIVSFYVGGFEGSSYAVVGITILIFTIVSYVLANKPNLVEKKSHEM